MPDLASFSRHVVLVGPEIAWNTGNAGRTCLGAGAALHLVKPLGFSLDESHVKRAGLDYWERVPLFVWESFEDFLAGTGAGIEELVLFTKTAEKSLWDMPRPPRMFLVFGSETSGLSSRVLEKFPHRAYHIPIGPGIRSLNLSTAVGIGLYESLRGTGISHEPRTNTEDTDAS
ncbi:MAG: tRNA (cytidine(34)-2'-O)-methyltransferase [Thermodesulfobacteriota bacterium]